MKTTTIYGKNYKPGIVPAIALCNPKHARNVGAVVRAACCFGLKQVWWSGNRVAIDPKKGERLPREERMKDYQSVEMRQSDYFFDAFGRDAVPVAIELRPGSELLPQFEHPDNALYVFGPEDGSIEAVKLRHCHRFVVIPTKHCVNLAAAVYMVLYDRMIKRQFKGIDPILPMSEVLAENRGWATFGNDKVLEGDEVAIG